MEINRTAQTQPGKQDAVSGRMQSVKGMEEGDHTGLRLSGELPAARQLDLYEPGQKDGIDWDYVSFRMSGSISLENGDQIMRHVNSAVSVYVTTKTRLEEQYAGQEEVLAEKLGKLDHMFAQFKQRTVSSYGQSVGGFYEKLGNKGIKDRRGVNLSAAVDQRVKDMEAMVEEGRFDRAKENSWQLLEIALDVSSLEEEKNGTVFHHSAEEGETYYSLNDLQAAGAAAKEAATVKEKIQNLIHDENLEFQMTFQHRRLLEFLEHLTAGREMENIIRQSMGTFTGHVFSSGSGGSGGREKSLEVQAASSFSAYA